MSMLLRKHLTPMPIVTDKQDEVKTDSTPKSEKKPTKAHKPKAESKND